MLPHSCRYGAIDSAREREHFNLPTRWEFSAETLEQSEVFLGLICIRSDLIVRVGIHCACELTDVDTQPTKI